MNALAKLEDGAAAPGVMMNEEAIDIRPFQPYDARSLFSAVRESMPQIRQWMAWCPADYSVGDSIAFVSACKAEWEADRKYSFVIYDRTNGMLLGSIGLSGVHRVHRMANLGYWVRSSRTGQGVASAAVRLAAHFAFGELRLNRLELIIAVGNHGSIRVAEKVGAKREGVLRHRLVFEGKPVDAVIYSLLAEDLQRRV